VYVADTFNHKVRKITPDGLVSTLAGSVAYSFADGQGTAAHFSYPSGIAVDSAGNMQVADTSNNRIRKITPGGLVSTFAGSAYGSADGPGATAQFSGPSGVGVDSAGNTFVADSGNNRIRKITPGGLVSTFAGSSDGFADGQGTAAQFSRPADVAVDSAGTVYVTDPGNRRVRKITPGGVVSTFAGSGDYGGVDGQGTAAQFNSPQGIAIDSADNVYVTEYYNHRIRKITPGGLVSTFAGAAELTFPTGVAVDSAGTVYVANYNRYIINKITPGGLVSTLAGSQFSDGFTDGQGTAAKFSRITDVAVDSAGKVYVTDTNLIRKIS